MPDNDSSSNPQFGGTIIMYESDDSYLEWGVHGGWGLYFFAVDASKLNKKVK